MEDRQHRSDGVGIRINGLLCSVNEGATGAALRGWADNSGRPCSQSRQKHASDSTDKPQRKSTVQRSKAHRALMTHDWSTLEWNQKCDDHWNTKMQRDKHGSKLSRVRQNTTGAMEARAQPSDRGKHHRAELGACRARRNGAEHHQRAKAATRPPEHRA